MQLEFIDKSITQCVPINTEVGALTALTEFSALTALTEVSESTKFTQSQSHGLIWDSEIRVKVFQLPECINDTKKYDIDCTDNIYCSQENVSIKTSCSGTIDCGDIVRFRNNDFTDGKYTNMIIIRYIQTRTLKIIQEIVEFKYDQAVYNFLFGSISEAEIESYCNYVKMLPKGEVCQADKMEYKKMKKILQLKHNMYINISPKVDSKAQRRVQCSIPKMDTLFAKFTQNILSRTTLPLVKGVEISSQIYSLARVRTKKVKVAPVVALVVDIDAVIIKSIIESL